MLEFAAGVALGAVVAGLWTFAWIWDRAFRAGRAHERGHPARRFEPLDGLSEVL